MEFSYLLRTLENLELGDHLCCIYETEEEHRSLVTPFLRHGLERNQKAIYIVDARTADTVIGYLRDDGLTVEPYLEKGQLVIMGVKDAYMKEGVFDPDGMIELLRSETELALSEGYEALRVTGEMTWALQGLPGSERLIEYESKLNEFFPGSRCMAICQYDKRRFDAEILLEVLTTHPIAIIGTEVFDNFYYLSPTEFMGPNPEAARFNRHLKNLADRKRAEQALDRRNKELFSLNVIANTIGRSLHLDRVLEDTLRTVLDMMGLRQGWIFLRDSPSNKLTLASHVGLPPEFLKAEAEEPIEDCIGFHVMEGKEALIAENIVECPRLMKFLPEGERPAYHASVPLISKEEVVGIMNLTSEGFRSFSEEDLQLLTSIGHQVGVAIENARLFEDTKRKTSELEEAYERLKSLYEELKEERRTANTLRKALEDKYGLANIVGKNHKMQAIYDLIVDVSQSDSTVLIQGESGTGKELIAHAIHTLSSRKGKPFVIANCSAYAETLLESELFGHEKGAFTGAIRRKKGRFELADGGTIFLDEIGEIPPPTQLLLLRVLQEKRFERVGGEQTVEVDVRLIAATNRDLNKEMMDGRFREDLYYRLNVIPVMVPPLRERGDDIPLLAKHFLDMYSSSSKKAIRGFSEEVMEILLSYNWPGNVRELQNVVEHAVILTKDELITESDLPHNLRWSLPQAEEATRSLKETEKNLIQKVLKEVRGNKYQAAKKLGITRSTLYGKMRKHGIMSQERA
ncbi:MAG: sigma 54-interacting transcriptional regulator [Deltaproteobacteria bacterium]|nr:sigma 54-interacting transcriptional regulator [Deltaproteobacteria bacterium]MBW2079124.1 sigma 54-interacting transcriptional regulator [Deltaproteobacteria bacterium]MBW2312162.1 sigma 54-interacting transcriptional regulator [Deltaproteobacteria bacterium]